MSSTIHPDDVPESGAAGVELVLASASSGRLATLRRAGVEPRVVVSGVAEDIDEPDPARHALALAERKAAAVLARLTPDTAAPAASRGALRRLVLGCDSVLALDGVIHGKPRDAAEATARWRRMRGRSGTLHTGHCLVDAASGAVVRTVASTEVTFAHLSDDEIRAYVATGEPLRVAGAFTVDGLGGPFVERVDGDPHNVVGISLPLLRLMLAELGVPWTALWSGSDRRDAVPTV